MLLVPSAAPVPLYVPPPLMPLNLPVPRVNAHLPSNVAVLSLLGHALFGRVLPNGRKQRGRPSDRVLCDPVVQEFRMFFPRVWRETPLTPPQFILQYPLLGTNERRTGSQCH